MTPEQLLAELEARTHPQRVKRMIELGRLGAAGAGGRAGDESAAALLRSLGSGGAYERRLALYATLGSRDAGPAIAGIADASALVRNLSCFLLPMLCDNAALAQLLYAADRSRRLRLIRGLRKRGRRGPIDAFLDAAVARGERNWAELLPFASASCVARHAERFSDAASAEHWRRMARSHPGLCADLLLQKANAADGLDARLRWHARAVLPTLARRTPGPALALVKSLTRFLSLAELSLDLLAVRLPNEVAELALAADQPRLFQFSGVAHRLSFPLLMALLQRHPQTLGQPERWMSRLPREHRAVAYAICKLAWRDREGALPVALIATLPEADRHREGRRHLDLPALATRPAQRIAYAAFLPWDEMLGSVEPLRRHPDADARAAAIATVVAAGRFDKQRLAEVLAMVAAGRNEQDPVRQRMLAALAALPPSRWNAQHGEDLGRILRHFLDAADASRATGDAAERFVVNVFPFQGEWSAQWLATIMRQRGMLGYSAISTRLSAAEVTRLAPTLLPVLQSWQTREREGQITAAAQTFGRRLRNFDGLADILESLAESSASHRVCEAALSTLAAERRDRAATLIPKLLKQDATWAMRPVVYNYLHRHRHDLLAPCLGRVAHRGRFSTGQTRFFLPVEDGFERWTPSQQATLAMTLGEVIDDAHRDHPSVLGVIRQLSAMPDIEPTRLIQSAKIDQARLDIRDAALRGLGRLDAGQGVTTLLDALNDDRARIAIYGLRRALLGLPPAVALPLLKQAPLTQVTVAKEVVRLVGELRTPDAYVELLRYDKLNLHRDVRAALLRALWSYLDRGESWEILQRAVASGDAGQADVASRVPADTLDRLGQQRLAPLMASLLAHPDAAVRVSVLRRLVQLPLNDPRQDMLAGLLSALASRLHDECSAAASALFSTYAGRQADVAGKAAATLLPNRYATKTMVDSLCAVLMSQHRQLAPSARAVLLALANDPLTITLRARLAVLALPAGELAEFFDNAAGSGALHADALAAAIGTLAQIAAWQGPTVMEKIERSLAEHPDERLRRLAFAALAAATEPNQSWSENQLERLAKYRRDPSHLVAGAAEFTFPVAVESTKPAARQSGGAN